MKRLKVMLSLMTSDNDYQREQASVADATARRLGIDLQTVYADSEAIGQTKQILDRLHATGDDRPDAVIVEPVGTGMPGVASAAVTRGIGWIVLNREADYLLPLRQGTTPVGCVVCDNTEVGRIQGRQFAALLPSGGTVLYVEGPATDISKQRRAGLDETLPANIKLQALRGKWTEDSGVQVVGDRLQWRGQGPPDIDLIGCQNDAMAMGARKAVEALPAGQREQWLKIPFTGVDGVPNTGQAWVKQGQLAATIITPPLTGMALELLTQARAAGTQMAERTLAKVTSFPALGELRPR